MLYNGYHLWSHQDLDKEIHGYLVRISSAQGVSTPKLAPGVGGWGLEVLNRIFFARIILNFLGHLKLLLTSMSSVDATQA